MELPQWVRDNVAPRDSASVVGNHRLDNLRRVNKDNVSKLLSRIEEIKSEFVDIRGACRFIHQGILRCLPLIRCSVALAWATKRQPRIATGGEVAGIGAGRAKKA